MAISKSKRPAPPPFKPASFVNIDLDKARREQLKATPYDLDQLDATFESLLLDGYKLSIRFDERNDCYAAWLIAPEQSLNGGAILAARGSHLSKALKALGFIHYGVLEGQWGVDMGQTREPIDD